MSKLFFLFIILFQMQLNATVTNNINKYSQYKKTYFKAILNNDKNLKIESLKKLIYYAQKVDKPVLKYKEELKLLLKENKISKTYKSKFVVKTNNYVSKKIIPKSTNIITKVRVKKNMIIIDFKNDIDSKYLKFSEENKVRYKYDNFDIKGSLSGVSKLKLTMKGIKDLKIKMIKKNYRYIRISLRGKENINTVYFFKKKRIVIKVLKNAVKNKKVTKVKIIKDKKAKITRKLKRRTIVIDPGHGGNDPGTIGSKKRYEKKVVLEVGKKLYRILKSRGYKVYMTRYKDKHTSLKYRTKFANKKHADIFLSIHANAVPKEKKDKIHGLETYYLSPARSERAKRVAAKENKADMKSMNYGTKNVFLMTQNRVRITASNKLALDVQNNLLYELRSKYKGINDNGVRKGPFWILVGAQMPSILVEVGYMSHYKESKRLYNRSYQTSIARGIANGIDSYFLKNK